MVANRQLKPLVVHAQQVSRAAHLLSQPKFEIVRFDRAIANVAVVNLRKHFRTFTIHTVINVRDQSDRGSILSISVCELNPHI